MLLIHQWACVFFQAPHLKNVLTGMERAAGISIYHLVPEKLIISMGKKTT